MKHLNNINQLKVDSVNNKIRAIFIEARGRTGRVYVAEKLSIHETTLKRLEDGEHDMSMEYFLKLCQIYNLDPVLTFQKAILTA